MQDTRKYEAQSGQSGQSSQSSQSGQSKTPERGTAEAASKERGKPATTKDGAPSGGKEPITTQNRTSTEE